LLAVKQWRYDPKVVDGHPVEVHTTITVEFSLRPPGPAKSSTVTEVSTSTAVTIHLKNGRTIHADTVQEAGERLEYTIGEGDYKISKSLGKEVTHAAPEAPPAVPAVPRGKAVRESESACAGCFAAEQR
jgi:hypothetical protein